MDKSLKIKLFVIFLFLIGTLSNYELVFVQTTSTSYVFNNLNFMIASICFGIIISTAIYNLTLYIYFKSKQHLFYALSQFATLTFLITLDSLNSKPFDTIFNIHSNILFDISQLFMLIFSLLFIKAFLKNYFEYKLDKLINIIVYLAIFDIFLSLILGTSILSRLVPIFLPIWLVLSEAKRVIKKHDIPFYYLFYGWHIVLFIVFIQYIGFVDYTGIIFPFFHLALALDALMLSMAISYKFKLLDEERVIQQSVLLQQSRLASMGEMVAIIAHQWRQPLNFLSFTLMNIKKINKTSEKTVSIVKDANVQLQYMSKTIENFRNFYNPNKSKEEFSISEACYNVLPISSLASKYITVIVNEDFNFFGNKNEFEQVILNILNNSSDIFTQKNIQNPKVTLCIDKDIIRISDNAGGVNIEHKDKIFEPYFSTKDGNDGIGLYIAKMIIEKQMKGELSFENKNDGVEFKIILQSTNIF